MTIKIVLHGAIRAALGGLKEFVCEARTPAEAINALFSQVKPTPPEPGKKWLLSIAGCNSRQALYSPIQGDTLHVMPAMVGAGDKLGAIIQIAVAVVLIAVALWNPLGWTAVASYMLGAGIALAAGGLIQLLMPQPKLDSGSTDTQEQSRYLGAAGNTVDSGTRIPIGYGRDKLWGHYVHFDVEAEPAPIDGQPPTSERRNMSNMLGIRVPGRI